MTWGMHGKAQHKDDELVNFYNEEIGNPHLPMQCKQALPLKEDRLKTRASRLLGSLPVPPLFRWNPRLFVH